jgi:hypothetical protein
VVGSGPREDLYSGLYGIRGKIAECREHLASHNTKDL